MGYVLVAPLQRQDQLDVAFGTMDARAHEATIEQVELLRVLSLGPLAMIVKVEHEQRLLQDPGLGEVVVETVGGTGAQARAAARVCGDCAEKPDGAALGRLGGRRMVRPPKQAPTA